MRGGWREWVLTTKNRDDVYYDGDFSLLELSEGSSIFLSHRIWKGGAIKFSPSKIVNFKWNSHYFFCGKKKIFSCSQELVFWSSFSAEFRQPDRDHLGDRNAGQCLRGQRVAFAEHLPGGQGGRAGWETARRAASAGCQGEPGPRPDRRAVAEEQCSLPSSFFRHSPHSIPHSVSTLPPVLPSAPRGRSLAPQTDPWHRDLQVQSGVVTVFYLMPPSSPLPVSGDSQRSPLLLFLPLRLPQQVTFHPLP